MIRILNRAECKVKDLGIFAGKVYYTKGIFGKAQTDIVKVIVLDTKIKRPRDLWGTKQPQVTANIDLYTSDGTVIEVQTDNRKFLEAIDKITIKRDPRDPYRIERGVY